VSRDVCAQLKIPEYLICFVFFQGIFKVEEIHGEIGELQLCRGTGQTAQVLTGRHRWQRH
jgi:hypothetical protein